MGKTDYEIFDQSYKIGHAYGSITEFYDKAGNVSSRRGIYTSKSGLVHIYLSKDILVMDYAINDHEYRRTITGCDPDISDRTIASFAGKFVKFVLSLQEDTPDKDKQIQCLKNDLITANAKIQSLQAQLSRNQSRNG